MNKQNIFRDPFAFVLLGALALLFVSLLGTYLDENPTPHLQGIENDYMAGEKAVSPLKRKEAFNRSLESLLNLENKYAPTHSNGKLYLEIGNNYYQLEEYPKAILYYSKAMVLRPRDSQVEKLISMAQAKLNINEKPKSSLLKQLFFFHGLLSLPELLQLFTIFWVFTLISASAYLWTNRKWLSNVTLTFLACSCLLLLSLLASYYFSPLEAVVVKSSHLYRDAGEEYAKVIEDPIPSGLKVKVLSVSDSGKWMKIETSNGVMGYIAFESVQII